uniref:Uncharacterized protein n=1 Tax=Knipowitschia caucasica TaxID=637954 RepID=A0AAV2LDN6_KNICA
MSYFISSRQCGRASFQQFLNNIGIAETICENFNSNSILLLLGSVTIGHSHFSLNIVPENMQRLTSLAYSLPQFHCNRCRMIGGRAVRALQLL